MRRKDEDIPEKLPRSRPMSTSGGYSGKSSDLRRRLNRSNQ